MYYPVAHGCSRPADVALPIYRKEEHMTVGKVRQVLAGLPDDVW
jgi:hypothetical protein